MSETEPLLLSRRAMLAGLSALAAAGVPRPATAASDLRWWKAYWNTRSGQLHVHNAAPAERVQQRTPLVCLHPSSYSGAFFAEFQALMATDRWVMCPDTLGFGQSAKPEQMPTMQDYALAVADMLDEMGFGNGAAGAVDLLGFHTGCFIAAELAVQRPDLVRRLVLPGIPFYLGAEREAALERTAKPYAYHSDPAQLGRMWSERVKWQISAVPMQRLLQLLAEELASGPNHWWAYNAVFTYPADVQLAKIKAPTLAVATGGDLFEPTQKAAEYIPNARVERYPDRDAPLFNEHYAHMAKVTRRFLDGET